MLIRLDPALLSVREELLEFLRRPFTDASCLRVEKELPKVAPAYRALAATKATWSAVTLPLLIDDPTNAFRPVAGIDVEDLPQVPLELLQAQVGLLHEDIHDYQERLSATTGREIIESGSSINSVLALRAFSLHEAVFLTFAGLFYVKHFGLLIDFSLTSLGESCLINRVRSATVQNFTEGAVRFRLKAHIDDVTAHRLLRSGYIADALESSQLDILESHLLDTYFSLSQRMQSDPTVAPRITRARQLCRWMALLEMVRLAGEPAFQPDAGKLIRLKLDLALPDAVITERAKALSSDKGIHRTPSGGLTLGENSLGHAITCCKRAVLSDVETQALGAHFEIHIKSYVKECVPSEDYVVRDGFESSNKHQGLNYDCDLILFEPRRQKIFFVQTKWKRNGRTANLDDELNQWRKNNSPLPYGISQLQGLRKRLSEKRVLDQVKDRLKDFRLTDEQILENSHFILVHTLPYFNAYLDEEVVLYEWNFFRNILLRGTIKQVQASNGKLDKLNKVPQILHHETLPLEDPERVLDYFYQTIGADLESMTQLMNVRMHARYGFDVDLQGCAWWRRFFGMGKLQVARPYL